MPVASDTITLFLFQMALLGRLYEQEAPSKGRKVLKVRNREKLTRGTKSISKRRQEQHWKRS